MEDEDKGQLQGMIDAVEEIAAISDYRNAYKKQFCNLSRRLKLLAPMFEELRESRDPIPAEAAGTLLPLWEALKSSGELLRFGGERSKICQHQNWIWNFAELLSSLWIWPRLLIYLKMRRSSFALWWKYTLRCHESGSMKKSL